MSKRDVDKAVEAVEFVGNLTSVVWAPASVVSGALKIGAIWASSNAAAREKARFERVIWEAALALARGDVDVAEAEIAAHVDDDDFRSRVHATVAKMREGAPVDAALPRLGLLVAAYQGRRVDTEFRRWLVLLCDANDAELNSLAQFAREAVPAQAYFFTGFLAKFDPRAGQQLVPISANRPNGDKVNSWSTVALDAEALWPAIDMLVAHGLMIASQMQAYPSGSPCAPHIVGNQYMISAERMHLFATIFGVDGHGPTR